MGHSLKSVCFLITTAVYPLRDCDGTQRDQKNDEGVISESNVKNGVMSGPGSSGFQW